MALAKSAADRRDPAMRIVQFHSHLGGWEHIQVHKPEIWNEIASVVEAVESDGSSVDPIQTAHGQIARVFASHGWSRASETGGSVDYIKSRIAARVPFGVHFASACDLYVKHMAFYVGDVINVGVEILPMKAMSSEMSSGISYYEGELYNVIRQGRGVPAVPLVLVGIAP